MVESGEYNPDDKLEKECAFKITSYTPGYTQVRVRSRG